MTDTTISERNACTSRFHTQRAAEEVLAVSERELQRLRDKGTEIATASDRAVRRLPDYKAIPWPVVTGADTTPEGHHNNMHLGRDSVNAVEFTAPFTDSRDARDARRPAFAAPGTLAASGNLEELHKSSFVEPGGTSTGLDGEPSFVRIARNLEQSVLRPASRDGPRHAPIPHQSTTSLSRGLSTNEEVAEYEETIASKAHGDPRHLVASFPSRLMLSLRGLLYDLTHFDQIRPEHLKRYGCFGRLDYAFLRDGRGPFLLVVAMVIALIAALI